MEPKRAQFFKSSNPMPKAISANPKATLNGVLKLVHVAIVGSDFMAAATGLPFGLKCELARFSKTMPNENSP
jgi:hypothetical protein